jgi:hypothetical protein
LLSYKVAVIAEVAESLPEPWEPWNKQLLEKLRRAGLAYNKEKTYRYWCNRFMIFCHPIKPEGLRMELPEELLG